VEETPRRVMLLRLLKLAKQAFKDFVDAWSVTAQKRIC
jgi:hypothetical protein